MNLKKISTLFWIIATLALATLACSWSDIFPGTPTATPIPVITDVSFPTATTAAGEQPASTSSPTDDWLVPPTPEATVTPGDSSTNAYGEACLPGTWKIDQNSVKDYINDSMAFYDYDEFAAKSVAGILSITFNTDGTVGMSARDFSVVLGVESGAFSDFTNFTFIAQSSGAAYYAADDDADDDTYVLEITNAAYDANAVLQKTPKDASAQSRLSVKLSLNDLLDFAQSMGFAKDFSTSMRAQNLLYECEGDTLVIQLNSVGDVTFIRVIE
ncbi:MAG: hypothetical protein JXB38_19785 [Anaerolineales bacterium]|nr:hypothetical protein [Anaerolineales bacterium]